MEIQNLYSSLQEKRMKRIHYFSGLLLSIFIVLHLFNHIYSVFGIEAHIQLMEQLRLVYRNIVVETLLILAIFVQIVSGIKLFFKKKKIAKGFFENLQLWSGFYLAFFFVFHISAVFIGRLVLQLDTNFYFGAIGLNTFPFYFFFLPYYALAILSFFGHIAAIHAKKMKKNLLGISPNKQAYMILIMGGIVTLTIFYGQTNGLNGFEFPEAYHLMTGK